MISIRIPCEFPQASEDASKEDENQEMKDSFSQMEREDQNVIDEEDESLTCDKVDVEESGSSSDEDESWMPLVERRNERRIKMRQVREIEKQMLKVKLLEEQTEKLRTGMSSEDVLNNKLDMPESFQCGEEEINHGPENKNVYFHRIEDHRINERGNIEAFKVIATKKEGSYSNASNILV